MDEFEFSETEMSTSIKELQNRTNEENEENIVYKNIRMKLYDDLNISDSIESINTKKYINNKKKKPNKVYPRKNNKPLYINILIFSLIFFMVNNYYFNEYLINKKFSYYIIVFFKLCLLLVLHYFYKYLMR